MWEVVLTTYNFKNVYHTEIKFGQFDIAMSKEDGIQLSRAVNKEDHAVYDMTLVSRNSLGFARTTPANFWSYLQRLRRHKNDYNLLTNNCRHISIMLIDYLDPPGATIAIMELKRMNRKLRCVQFVAKELLKPFIQLVVTLLTSIRLISMDTARKSLETFDWLLVEADGARDTIFSFIRELCPTLEVKEHTTTPLKSEKMNLNIYADATIKTPTFVVSANPNAMAITLIVMSVAACILALTGLSFKESDIH